MVEYQIFVNLGNSREQSYRPVTIGEFMIFAEFMDRNDRNMLPGLKKIEFFEASVDDFTES